MYALSAIRPGRTAADVFQGYHDILVPLRLRELHPLRPRPRDGSFGGGRALARPARRTSSSSPTCSSTSTSGSRTGRTGCASRTGCWSRPTGFASSPRSAGRPSSCERPATRPPSVAPCRSAGRRSWSGRRPSSGWRARTVRPRGPRPRRRISSPGSAARSTCEVRGVPAHGRAGHRGAPLLARGPGVPGRAQERDGTLEGVRRRTIAPAHGARGCGALRARRLDGVPTVRADCRRRPTVRPRARRT